MALYRFSERVNSFTGTAGETITIGDFVKIEGTAEATTSTAIDTADLLYIMACNATGDENTCIGVAGNSATDGNIVTVYTEGIYLFKVESGNGAIVAGKSVQKADTTDTTEVELLDAADNGRCIGVALTPANADDEYVVVLMRIGGGPSIVV